MTIDHQEMERDPFEGFTAKKAREILEKRKYSKKCADQFELTHGISKVKYDAIVSYILDRIHCTVDFSDETKIQLYLTERYFAKWPNKWVDPDFRKKLDEFLLSEGAKKLMQALMSDFKNHGFEFNYQFISARDLNVDLSRLGKYHESPLEIYNENYLDVLVNISWGYNAQ